MSLYLTNMNSIWETGKLTNLEAFAVVGVSLNARTVHTVQFQGTFVFCD